MNYFETAAASALYRKFLTAPSAWIESAEARHLLAKSLCLIRRESRKDARTMLKLIYVLKIVEL